MDLLSTCVVLWRFFAPTSLDDALEQKLKQREERASVAISFIMVALGFSILATAFADFARGAEDAFQEEAVIVMSFFSILLFGTISMLKFRFAARLDSPSMYKDGICSLIGTILAVTLLVNTIIVIRNPSVWWIDPIVALMAGIAAIYLGVRALWMAYTSEGLPIFSRDWWSGATTESTSKTTSEEQTKGSDSARDGDIV